MTDALIPTLAQGVEFVDQPDDFFLYGAVGILILMAVVFGGFNVVMSQHLFGPKRQGRTKGIPYESGMNPIGDARRRFNVRFYLIAMVFLVFDVEIVFLYPWAMTFPSLNDMAGSIGAEMTPWFIGRMLFFVFTTVIAFAYAFRKGVFKYD
ncbi:MAG: NADH-quinone oxidoreductase subunit A [Planctomycetota bacterium]